MIQFYCQPSLKAEKRKLTCQAAKVNKILASVAGFCDAGCEVIFRKKGGVIRNLDTGEVTPFRRVGNIYVMDAYIPNPDFAHDEMEVDDEATKNDSEATKSPGFTRQGAR